MSERPTKDLGHLFNTSLPIAFPETHTPSKTNQYARRKKKSIIFLIFWNDRNATVR